MCRLASYFSFYEKEKNTLHAVAMSAHLHEKLVTIHPFIDGNGRTARLIMNLVLLQNSYTIVNITGDNASRINYYNALDKCQSEYNCNDFLILVATEELKSISDYLNTIKTGNGK